MSETNQDSISKALNM